MLTIKNESLKEKKARAWEEQAPLYENLRKRGVQDFFSSISGIEHAFRVFPERPYLVCGDEGTVAGISFIEGNPRHLAGSGILMDEEKLLFLLRKMKVNVITSHDGCGAALLAQKPAGLWAREIAKKAGIFHAHIPLDAMKRPPEFHNARMIVYGAAPAFNWNAVSGLPPSFSCTDRTLVSPRYAQEELQMYGGIATGSHGFGPEFINEKNPLMLVVAGDSRHPKLSLSVLAREAEEARKTFSFPNMIEIHTFEL